MDLQENEAHADAASFSIAYRDHNGALHLVGERTTDLAAACDALPGYNAGDPDPEFFVAVRDEAGKWERRSGG